MTMAVAQKDVIPFDFMGSKVTTVLINNNPYWVLKEVCQLLEIENVGNVSARLSEKEKLTSTLWISGQNREVTLVNESGLYKSVFKSRKPEAEEFVTWVTSEVLPQIRKTGSYQLPQNPLDQVLLLAQELTKTATIAKEALERVQALEPKAIAYTQVMEAENTQTITEVAKVFGFSGIWLGKWLREKKICYDMGKKFLPFQKYIDKEYFVVIETKKENRDESGNVLSTQIFTQTRVPGKGIDFIRSIIYGEVTKW